MKNITAIAGPLLALGFCLLDAQPGQCFYNQGACAPASTPAPEGAAIATPPVDQEYGPFGEVNRATGLLAKANPFRFSTKYQDDETDLLYYGYRYLNTSTGRWLSRDPIEEPGFQMTAQSPKRPLDPERERDDAALPEIGRSVPRLASVVNCMRNEVGDRARAELESPPTGGGYMLVHNDPVNSSDVLGLRIWIHVCFLHQLCRPKVAAVVSVTLTPVPDAKLQLCCDAANRLYGAIDFPTYTDVIQAEVFFQTCCSGWAKK
jgi:RHS repeat-associated protein